MDLQHCARCGAPMYGVYRCPACAAVETANHVEAAREKEAREGDRRWLPPWRFDRLGLYLRYREYSRQVDNGER
jgi:uncharacterized Zn finger protein (UPF0148 family)